MEGHWKFPGQFLNPVHLWPEFQCYAFCVGIIIVFTFAGVPTFNLSSSNAVENDILSATCQADYRGIINPSVTFQQSKSKVNLGNITDMSIMNQVAVATYNFTAAYDLNGVVMSCMVASLSASQQLALNISCEFSVYNRPV